MAEQTTKTGDVSWMARDTYEKLVSTYEVYSKTVAWACFTKTPFTKAIGVEAFGVEPMTDLAKFGTASPRTQNVRYVSGVYGISGQVFATKGTPFFSGRMGSMTPELTEGGDEWAYSFHQLNKIDYIPLTDVQDNSKGLIDIKAQRMEGMKQSIVEGFNQSLLGDTSNGPTDLSTIGPTALKSDLPNLISKTQTHTVGGIATTNSYWQNKTATITSVGGGSEMDRPLVLRRALITLLNDVAEYAESGNRYLIVTTQGGWEYFDRLMYADVVQAGKPAVLGTNQVYDAAGIQNFAFAGHPMIWDPSVQTPTGGTASKEFFYLIDLQNYAIALRSEENFKVRGWEQARVHDQYWFLAASITVRFTPLVTSRRTQALLYDVPQNPDTA